MTTNIVPSTPKPATLWNRRRMLTALFLGAMLLLPASLFAAVPYVSGSYATPLKSGAFKFNPVKRVIQFGYQGNFVVSGKSYPGVLYAIRGTSNVGMAWYYGVSGIQAGAAVVTTQPDGTLTGTIEFTDRKGNITDSGSITLK